MTFFVSLSFIDPYFHLRLDNQVEAPNCPNYPSIEYAKYQKEPQKKNNERRLKSAALPTLFWTLPPTIIHISPLYDEVFGFLQMEANELSSCKTFLPPLTEWNGPYKRSTATIRSLLSNTA